MRVDYGQFETTMKAMGYRLSKNIKDVVELPPGILGDRVIKGGRFTRKKFYKKLPAGDKFEGDAWFCVEYVQSTQSDKSESMFRVFFKTKNAHWVDFRIFPLNNEQISMGISHFEKQLLEIVQIYDGKI